MFHGEWWGVIRDGLGRRKQQSSCTVSIFKSNFLNYQRLVSAVNEYPLETPSEPGTLVSAVLQEPFSPFTYRTVDISAGGVQKAAIKIKRLRR